MKRRLTSRSQPRPAAWSGLLLGFLLTLFLATFLYVAYLFLTLGQTAVAQLPRLPPLALPQLVRPAPANAAAARTHAGVLWQPAPQQTPGVEQIGRAHV